MDKYEFNIKAEQMRKMAEPRPVQHGGDGDGVG